MPKAYLTSGWNILDFSIVVVSVVVLFAEAVPALRQLRTLRLLRVLRPLRILSRLASMRLIMSSLIKSVPSVLNTAAVVFLFMVVFAILVCWPVSIPRRRLVTAWHSLVAACLSTH